MSKTSPFIMTFAQTIVSAISIEAASADEARERAVDRYQRDADLLIMNPSQAARTASATTRSPTPLEARHEPPAMHRDRQQALSVSSTSSSCAASCSPLTAQPCKRPCSS